MGTRYSPRPGWYRLGTAFPLPLAGRIDVGVHSANVTLLSHASLFFALYLSLVWQVWPIRYHSHHAIRANANEDVYVFCS
jgi:hypothetical protein